MKEQIKIRVVLPNGQEKYIWTMRSKKLWESLASAGIDTGGVCAGNGSCGKCKVRVEGESVPISDREREHLLPEEVRAGMRLACFYPVHHPLTVYIDYLDRNQGNKTLEGQQILPADRVRVQWKRVFIPGLDPVHPISVHRRLRDALPEYNLDLDIENLNFLSRLDRDRRPALELKALIIDQHIVKRVGKKQFKAYGVAIDLGTTTIFASLLDLESQEIVAMVSRNNMQRVYGADLISRLSFAMEAEDGLATLQQVLLNNVNACIEEMVQEIKIETDEIVLFSAAGNPVMLHFFMGLNPCGFTSAPYGGVFIDGLKLPAADVGLQGARDAQLLILPQIGGFVGADTTACLIALPESENQDYLLVDIGTNGEVVLSHHGQIWAASAAAGPAFEGGGISCGMRAGDGAIDRVYLDDSGNLQFNILGGGDARGLCGSGVIDLIHCFRVLGVIDENGIIVEDALSGLQIDRSERGARILLPLSEKGGSLIYLDQEDIRQIQLAKAALRSAIDMLFMEAGVDTSEIDCLYLAGTFGNYIHPASAVGIGMLPPIPLPSIKGIGNAAGQGAIKALLSVSAWDKAMELQAKVQYVELADMPDFQDLYLRNINF